MTQLLDGIPEELRDFKTHIYIYGYKPQKDELNPKVHYMLMDSHFGKPTIDAQLTDCESYVEMTHSYALELRDNLNSTLCSLNSIYNLCFDIDGQSMMMALVVFCELVYRRYHVRVFSRCHESHRRLDQTLSNFYTLLEIDNFEKVEFVSMEGKIDKRLFEFYMLFKWFFTDIEPLIEKDKGLYDWWSFY